MEPSLGVLLQTPKLGLQRSSQTIDFGRLRLRGSSLMTHSKNSQARGSTEKAKVWLKPGQVEQLRNAAYQVSARYLQQRNELLVQFIYDTGLRVGEAVRIETDYLRDGNQKLYLPGPVQKDYPLEGESPEPATIGLTMDTPRLLTAYLTSRWKDSDYLFPSRQSASISTEAVRNVIRQLAMTANISPFTVSGGRGAPTDVSPHSLRHSVAWRMLNAEEGKTMYDVRNRLRHRSIQTTERIYDHIAEI